MGWFFSHLDPLNSYLSRASPMPHPPAKRTVSVSMGGNGTSPSHARPGHLMGVMPQRPELRGVYGVFRCALNQVPVELILVARQPDAPPACASGCRVHESPYRGTSLVSNRARYPCTCPMPHPPRKRAKWCQHSTERPLSIPTHFYRATLLIRNRLPPL